MYIYFNPAIHTICKPRAKSKGTFRVHPKKYRSVFFLARMRPRVHHKEVNWLTHKKCFFFCLHPINEGDCTVLIFILIHFIIFCNRPVKSCYLICSKVLCIFFSKCNFLTRSCCFRFSHRLIGRTDYYFSVDLDFFFFFNF